MKKHVELVKKFLADNDSISLEELEELEELEAAAYWASARKALARADAESYWADAQAAAY